MTKPIIYLMLLVGGAFAAGTGVVTYGEWRQAQRATVAAVPAEPTGPAESDVAAGEAPPARADRPVTVEESLAVPQPAPAAPAGPMPNEPVEAERELAALPPADPAAEVEVQQARPPQPAFEGETQPEPQAAAESAAPEVQEGAAEPSEPAVAVPSEPAVTEPSQPAVTEPSQPAVTEPSQAAADAEPGPSAAVEAPEAVEAPAAEAASSAPPSDSAALRPQEEPAPPPAASPPPQTEPAETAPEMPSFDIVRVEPTGEAVIAGRAPRGAKVEILSNGEVVAETSADEGGNWVALPARPLSPGSHDLTIRTLSPQGEQKQSEQHVAVAVPDGPGEEVVAILGAPGRPSEVLAGPGAEPPAASSEPPRKLEPMATATGMAGASGVAAAGAPVLSVDAVEAEGRTMYVAGAGDPGALVRVYVDGELVGEAEAGAGGRWLVEGTRALEEEGEVTVRADQLEVGTAQVEARAEVPFVRRLDMAALVPAARGGGGAGDSAEGGGLPQPEAVIIRRGDNLWTISRRTYGRGVRYTTIYKANQEQIRDPHWIYPGQVFVLPERDRAWAGE